MHNCKTQLKEYLCENRIIRCRTENIKNQMNLCGFGKGFGAAFHFPVPHIIFGKAVQHGF